MAEEWDQRAAHVELIEVGSDTYSQSEFENTALLSKPKRFPLDDDPEKPEAFVEHKLTALHQEHANILSRTKFIVKCWITVAFFLTLLGGGIIL